MTRMRPRRLEVLIEWALFACALVSIGTTAGIILVLASETAALSHRPMDPAATLCAAHALYAAAARLLPATARDLMAIALSVAAPGTTRAG